MPFSVYSMRASFRVSSIGKLASRSYMKDSSLFRKCCCITGAAPLIDVPFLSYFGTH